MINKLKRTTKKKLTNKPVKNEVVRAEKQEKVRKEKLSVKLIDKTSESFVLEVIYDESIGSINTLKVCLDQLILSEKNSNAIKIDEGLMHVFVSLSLIDVNEIQVDLSGESAVLVRPKGQGRIDELVGGLVHGWYTNEWGWPGNNIQVKTDKGNIYSIELDIEREYVDSLFPNNKGYKGFCFKLSKEDIERGNLSLSLLENFGDEFVLCTEKFNEESNYSFAINNLRLEGYYASDNPVLIIEIDGLEYEYFCVKGYKNKHQGEKGIQLGAISVDFKFPQLYFDNNDHKIRVKDLSNNVLLESVFNSGPIVSQLDAVNKHSLVGWCFLKDYPNTSLDLELKGLDLETNNNHLRQDVAVVHSIDAPCGFSFDILEGFETLRNGSIDIVLKDTEIRVLRNSFSIESPNDIINDLFVVQQQLHSLNNKTALDAVESALNLQRKSLRFGEYRLKEINDVHNKSNGVDVIVPIYAGYSETIECINSAISARDLNKVKYNVILVDDCGPDENLRNTIKQYPENYDFVHMLINPRNKGFVYSVNKGMQFSENDVLLLNSDTIVRGDWVDRIFNAANSDNTIATVTPMSNNATICSYPFFCEDNKLVLGKSAFELDNIFSKSNIATELIELPTAHGFCMFIKREALNDVGFFDEVRWKKGYGEENDFSIRANSRGWKNVCTPNVFVYHKGSVSFGADAEGFIAKNLNVLNSLYPEYSGNVQSFIATDPMIKARRNVSVSILKESGDFEFPILYISHGIGGGTETHVRSLIDSTPKTKGWLLLELKNDKYVVETSLENIQLEFFVDEYEEMVSILKSFRLDYIHLHHFMDLDFDIQEFLREFSQEYIYTIHDYLSICPRVNLVDHKEKYCNEPNEKVCNTCIKRGVHESLSSNLAAVENIEDWRALNYQVLKNAKKVIVPTEDVKTRLKRYFQDIDISVIYHPEKNNQVNFNPRLKGELNVAIIGAIGNHKGYSELFELVEYCSVNELPINFTLIGYSADDDELSKFDNIHITGKFDSEEELKAHVISNNCNLALFLSIWPETYSYTLSEAIKLNLWPISHRLGAVGERIKKYGVGTIVDSLEVGDLVDAIMVLSNSNFEKSKSIKIGSEPDQIRLFN